MPGIDFRAARARRRLADVLALVGFPPRRGWDGQVRGPCPVHRSRSRTSRAFVAHLGKGVWHCFACGAGGNGLDLWVAVTRQPLHAAVLDRCQRLGQEVPWLPQRSAPARRTKELTMPEPCGSHADRAGELQAERRPTWDERHQGYGEQRLVGDVDPGKYPYATAPDRMGLHWPPARLGPSSWGIAAATRPRGCPRVEPCDERARVTERAPMVWKSRRGERVSFQGAGRNVRPSWGPFRGPATDDLDDVFGAAWVLQPRGESPRRRRKAPVKGSGCSG